MRPGLERVRRVVVKIGSSSLTHKGKLSSDKMRVFAQDIASLRRSGIEVIIVSSGAISAGCGRMKCPRENLSVPRKQALAAVGQTILMNEYRAIFVEEGFDVAQILLTEEDFKNRERYLNIRNTMNELLHMGVIPIVNENDTVAVKEIKVGDNDTLSAYVSVIADASLLVLLTDIDGFYYDLKSGRPEPLITAIDARVLAASGGSGSLHGTGGMLTKIRAADMVMKSGQMMIIAPAAEENVISRIVAGEEIGTLFSPHAKAVRGRKRWISFNMAVRGRILIDAGAEKALTAGKKSLLASGITGCTGKFASGDGVEIAGADGNILARGITNFSSDEILLVKGRKSGEIKKILGDAFYEEVVHRDNLILTGSVPPAQK